MLPPEGGAACNTQPVQAQACTQRADAACQQGSCACLESMRPVKSLGAVLFAAGRSSGVREASKHSAIRSMPAALGCSPSGRRPCRVLSTVRQGSPAETSAVGREVLTCRHRRMQSSHSSPGRAKAQPQHCASIRKSLRSVTAEAQAESKPKRVLARGPWC